jgi:hypothetical protein
VRTEVMGVSPSHIRTIVATDALRDVAETLNWCTFAHERSSRMDFPPMS